MEITNQKSIHEHLCQWTVSRQPKSLLVPENYKLYLTVNWWPVTVQRLKMVQSVTLIQALKLLLSLVYSGVPNENIVENHLNIGLLNIF